ncbi:dynein regulatory complex protein 9 [Anabas testudineus]|uniref:Dynein regulatory complex protein 9 n=1 Tax=Anabas testudineus TaxID=64144 RepID=A0A7N6BUF6_ANATE|nr:dynein regulatory complex protein 9 [Anabas testudineus]XP_026226859.1 dynein regulatory complex protein 9 [Anabas testudineus]
MSLSRIQSLGIAAVLEDCSNQLDIVGHIVRVQISRERGAAAAQERARLSKLRRDCQYISKQIYTLHLELEEKQSFSSMLNVMEEEEQKKMDENLKREEKIKLVQRRKALQRKKEELQQKNEQLKELNRHSRDLRHQANEHSLKSASRKKNAEKDVELQLQLTQKETSQAEKLLEDQLELLQKQLKEEVRVHKEAEKFLQNQQEELQQQLQQWQQLTNQMLEEKEQQLNSVSCKRTVNWDKLSEMRRTFREMEQVVMEDREEQEKLRQQQEQARAATKLQAWWRGCMVRRGLGTFKKTDEGKKGKKKKEGKKKKK